MLVKYLYNSLRVKYPLLLISSNLNFTNYIAIIMSENSQKKLSRFGGVPPPPC